jgi:23S rRNA (cytidine1920-2'-O)/16S rRNA (cytidine1409-2'-O)-methyltransferase
VARTRLDRLLVLRGLAPTREKAQALILAGSVSVGGKRADKAGTPVDETLRSPGRRTPTSPAAA